MAWTIQCGEEDGKGDLHGGNGRQAEAATNLPCKPSSPVEGARECKLLCRRGCDGEEEEEVLPWDCGNDGNPIIGTELSVVQKRELGELLCKQKHSLTNLPGRTNLVRHTIESEDGGPIRLQPYRLPHAYLEVVRRELEEMEAHSIIQTSNSEWAAPIVLVRKKDETLHVCVVYRRLNAVTQVDAYHMPRIDDLIDHFG